MPWFCHRTPQHAIADLHMLAVDIYRPSFIPRCPVSSVVIVWSWPSFISLASGSVGLGEIWVWAALSGSLKTDYYLNITPFLAQNAQLYAYNRHLSKEIPQQKSTRSLPSCSRDYIYLPKGLNNDLFYTLQSLMIISNRYTFTLRAGTIKHFFQSCMPVGTVSARVGKSLSMVFLRNTPGQSIFVFIFVYRHYY